MSSIFDLFKRIEKDREAKEIKPITHIVAGLGNPGREYADTRHNCGFIALDKISEQTGIRVDRAKFDALTGDGEIGGVRVLLMKPQTFMNESGVAIKKAADYYSIPPENVIVIFDDASLPVGNMRIRTKGSSGGHNGIKSVIDHLGCDLFPRVKIGIGEKPHPDYDIKDWVLGKFEPSDRKKIDSAAENCLGAVELMLKGEYDAAMGKYNTKKTAPAENTEA